MGVWEGTEKREREKERERVQQCDWHYYTCVRLSICTNLPTNRHLKLYHGTTYSTSVSHKEGRGALHTHYIVHVANLCTVHMC